VEELLREYSEGVTPGEELQGVLSGSTLREYSQGVL